MKQLSDLTAPAVIAVKPMLEAEVQKRCVAWMRARGYWARKFSSQSQRSVPDYLFSKAAADDYSLEGGFALPPIKFFTEFKREGCKLDKVTGLMSTEAQVEEQDAMRAAGWWGFECSDIKIFKATVIELEGSLLC
jgi:hypothetical protein